MESYGRRTIEVKEVVFEQLQAWTEMVAVRGGQVAEQLGLQGGWPGVALLLVHLVRRDAMGVIPIGMQR